MQWQSPPTARGNTMSASEDYRQIAAKHRVLAQQESLPSVRALFAASADKWDFLADVTARERAPLPQ